MKLQINRPIIGGVGISEFNSAVMRTLERFTTLIPGLEKWRCIIEEWDSTELIWRFDVSPAAGNGNECAEEKIATLGYFPKIVNTGELRDKAISDQENLDRLKVQTGQSLVHWYGGIRLRLTDYSPSSSEHIGDFTGASTEIRVAFSGARQDADAFIATAVMLTINDTWAKNNPNMYTHYDLKPLEDDPVTGLALNILR